MSLNLDRRSGHTCIAGTLMLLSVAQGYFDGFDHVRDESALDSGGKAGIAALRFCASSRPLAAQSAQHRKLERRLLVRPATLSVLTQIQDRLCESFGADLGRRSTACHIAAGWALIPDQSGPAKRPTRIGSMLVRRGGEYIGVVMLGDRQWRAAREVVQSD